MRAELAGIRLNRNAAPIDKEQAGNHADHRAEQNEEHRSNRQAGRLDQPCLNLVGRSHL